MDEKEDNSYMEYADEDDIILVGGEPTSERTEEIDTSMDDQDSSDNYQSEQNHRNERIENNLIQQEETDLEDLLDQFRYQMRNRRTIRDTNQYLRY